MQIGSAEKMILQVVKRHVGATLGMACARLQQPWPRLYSAQSAESGS